MSLIKKLASDTAAYGISSILARFINYLFSFIIVKAVTTAEYGDFTKFYAYAGFIQVVLTHGMETSYFRFRSKNGHHPEAFGTSFISTAVLSLIFLVFCYIFQSPISIFTRVADNPEFVLLFAWIMVFDTLCAIPFASLRANNKAIKFAIYRVLNIIIYIFFMVLFLFWLPQHYDKAVDTGAFWVSLYKPDFGVGYVFVANLIASLLTFMLLFKELGQIKFGISTKLYKEMIPYALPIMLVGFAGMINEMLSRIMMEYLLPYDPLRNKEILGIFGFNYKFAMLIYLFIQAYRYAAEPLFLEHAEKSNAKKVYADSMHYFIIAASFLFLFVMISVPFIQHFLMIFDAKYKIYFDGQNVIPILLGANILLGIHFNLSTWYKVTDKTHIGALIAFFGAGITILTNWLLIPTFGYTGAAYATFLCYLSMVTVSYLAERFYYPIHYRYQEGFIYLFFSILLWKASDISTYAISNIWLKTGISLIFLLIFVIVIYIREIRNLRLKRA